jgi:hypothetical protein
VFRALIGHVGVRVLAFECLIRDILRFKVGGSLVLFALFVRCYSVVAVWNWRF